MKLIYTDIAELSFDKKESILTIKMNEGVQMNLINTKKHYELIKELTEDKPYIALVDASYFFTIDEAASKHASLPEVLGKRIATAYYSLELPNRLTIDFFRNFYKPPILTRSFKTKEEAVEWLKKQKMKYLN